jgi:choice-of-anchor B domain-containing protein
MRILVSSHATYVPPNLILAALTHTHQIHLQAAGRPLFAKIPGSIMALLTLLALQTSTVAAQSHSCASGQAGMFACENVDLIARLDRSALGLEAGIRLNDLWAWEDPASGRAFALVGSMAGVTFVDVTQPDTPRVVGHLPRTPGSGTTTWRDMKVIGNHMYVVADGSASSSHGMQVFDLTALRTAGPAPETFQATTVYTGIGAAHNVVANASTNLILIVGANGGGTTCGGGLHMVDVSDPLNATFAGCFTDSSSRRGYTHDAQCLIYDGPDTAYRGREICAGYNEDRIVISDITDRQSPRAVGVASYPGSAYIHQGWFTDDHRYLIQNDELDENAFGHTTRTRIFDVSDLEDPILVSTFSSPNASIDHNLYVKDQFVFQANYSSGLQILDVSDPENPVRSGWFDTYPADNNANFNGAWTAYPFLSNGSVLVSDRDNGLFVLGLREQGLTTIDQVVFDARPSAINVTGRVASIRAPASLEFRIGRHAGFVTESQRDVSTTGPFSFSIPDLEAGRYPVQLVLVEQDGQETIMAEDILFVLPESLVLKDPFPNPAGTSTRVTVLSKLDQHVRVALFDARGREVEVLMDRQMVALSEEVLPVDTSSLAAGLYYVRASGEGMDLLRTVVVAR